jgi:hypothetical protein
MKFHWLIAAVSVLGGTHFSHAQTPDPVNVQAEVERLLHHGGAVMNAIDLDQMGLSRAKTPTQPWTSSYWPDSIGGIATRYGKNSVLGAKIETLLNFGWNKGKWKDRNYRMKKNVLSLTEDEIAQNLSPSEKYDLLMGDMDFTLTNNIIAEIDYRFDHKLDWNTGIWADQKGMTSWVGICDGWTVASLHTPRPVHAVRVRGATGQMVTFYPDDLKGLASHLFARTNQWLGIERVGNRCQKMSGKKDEFGRPKEADCRDVDAGIWHAAVMNRIGIDKRGFIIDIDNNTKVNNHPVFGYEVQYFNPINGRIDSIQKSTVPIDEVVDRKSGFFHKDATHMVGVRMTVNMLDYAWPTGEENDSPAYDKLRSATYVYALELDPQGQILGGEWQSQGKKFLFFGDNAEKQPDMVWMIAPYQLAWSLTSTQADDGPILDPKNFELWGNVDWRFKGDGRIPTDWFYASQASARFAWPKAEPFSTITSPHPLAEMVYYLFDRARK